MDASDAILRFLEGLGRRSEAEFYLRLFRAEAKESFAALAVESTVLRQALEAVVLDLRFLHGLGLSPVVVLGLYGPGSAAGEHATRLCRRLERAEVPASVHPAEAPDLADRVRAEARRGALPLVAFDAQDRAPLGARMALLGALVAELRTRKLIFLGRRGGLVPRGAEAPVPIVNLATDYEALAGGRVLAAKQKLLLIHARRLLQNASHPMLVAVTSPLELLRELFTVRGAGTLIKRGATLLRRQGLLEVDLERLRALLCSSFGRPLLGSFFDRAISRVYLEEAYRGAAVVVESPLGAYLTKFAVEREAQGEGIGRDLWQLLAADYATLFWRARPDNPVAPWYVQLCDGMARFSEWQVFWRGLAPSRIPEAIAYALDQPVDFG